jgi:hypothetical protein
MGLDEGRGFRAASKLAYSLNEVWSHNGRVEAWKVAGRIFEESWRSVRPPQPFSDIYDSE